MMLAAEGHCDIALQGVERAVRLQVTGDETTRRAPVPLSTLEMQKKGTGVLRTSGDNIMSAAESLYQKGLISYPRTETDQFDPTEDLHVRPTRWLFST